MREAPTREPTAGKLAAAALVGEGAGAATGSVAATTALKEAVAKRRAHAIFLISMVAN